MQTQMQAAVYLEPGKLAVKSLVLPEPEAGEVRVRVRACGFCGSDLHLLHMNPSLVERGVTMGHEIAGEIDAISEGIEGLSPGERVVVEPLHSCGICRHCGDGRDSICPAVELYGIGRPGGFAQYITVPAKRVFRAPSTLEFPLLALAEPIAVAVHGLRLGGFRPGQRVLVLGAGSIGLATARVARASGASEVILTARYPHQAEAGRRLGAEVLTGDDTSAAALGALGSEKDIDMVVETVGGSATTLQDAVAAIMPGGSIVVLGVFLEPVVLDPFTLFFKEGCIQWSNCYSRAPGAEDFNRALQLIEQDSEVWSHMLTHAVPLDEIDKAVAIAGDKNTGVIKVSIIPGH